MSYPKCKNYKPKNPAKGECRLTPPQIVPVTIQFEKSQAESYNTKTSKFTQEDPNWTAEIISESQYPIVTASNSCSHFRPQNIFQRGS